MEGPWKLGDDLGGGFGVTSRGAEDHRRDLGGSWSYAMTPGGIWGPQEGFGEPQEPRGSSTPTRGRRRDLAVAPGGEKQELGIKGGQKMTPLRHLPSPKSQDTSNILGTSGWVWGLLETFWGPLTHTDEGSHDGAGKPAQVTIGHVLALKMKNHGTRGTMGVLLLPRRLVGPQGSSLAMEVQLHHGCLAHLHCRGTAWPWRSNSMVGGASVLIVGVQHDHRAPAPWWGLIWLGGSVPVPSWGSNPTMAPQLIIWV